MSLAIAYNVSVHVYLLIMPIADKNTDKNPDLAHVHEMFECSGMENPNGLIDIMVT